MAPRKKTTKDIEAELRQAIEKMDRTVYRLAAESGVSAGQIGRFAKGERTLTLTAAGKLASALGLHLSPVADPSPVAVAPVAAVAVQDGEVLAAIRSNTKRTGAAKLADVFRSLQAKDQALTLGTFHDALRRLRTAGKVELSPWTGAAYTLKDGEACLVLGTEIMAFVSLR